RACEWIGKLRGHAEDDAQRAARTVGARMDEAHPRVAGAAELLVGVRHHRQTGSRFDRRAFEVGDRQAAILHRRAAGDERAGGEEERRGRAATVIKPRAERDAHAFSSASYLTA